MTSGRPPQHVITRIEALRAQIHRHDRLYFVENAPEISDEEYDGLVIELKSLEAAYPELVTPDSPTQRVGGRPLDEFAHVRHAVPMLSIDNTYSEAELRQFDDRVRKGLGGEPYAYLVDAKIDGVAVTLRYERGFFALGATRGDGTTGDDITQNLRTIRGIPLRLQGHDVPTLLEVRGEVYWPRPEFTAYNEGLIAEGKPPFANPRNATAGTLKQLDSRKVGTRKLAFCCHGVGVVEPLPAQVETYSRLERYLHQWGIPTNPHARRCADIDEVLAFMHEWETRRHDLEYDTDGLVVKVDRFDQRQRLGATAKAPRWCIAYKFAAQRARTRLVSVDFQVGKLGTITPVANLEPAQLAGTVVRRASLHNFDQVRRLELHVGDLVTVEKAGEIIPQVVEVDASQRPSRAKPVRPPDACPACEGPVVQDEGGVYLRCTNPSCPAQLVERLRFFCARGQMDVQGAGEKLIEALVRAGLVRSYADLYRLHDKRTELINLERMGEKSADNLLSGVEQSKRQPLARLLAALNIRHVGSNTAQLLATAFGSMEAIQAADEDALQQVPGIGPEVSGSLRAWLDSDAGKRTIAELAALGVNMTEPKTALRGTGALAGKTIVVTGTLKRHSRAEIHDLIRMHGGTPSSSVSRKTDYLIAGDAPGSKLKQAQALRVKILSEDDLLHLLGGDSA